jgi:hypothetical protein
MMVVPQLKMPALRVLSEQLGIWTCSAPQATCCCFMALCAYDMMVLMMSCGLLDELLLSDASDRVENQQ